MVRRPVRRYAAALLAAAALAACTSIPADPAGATTPGGSSGSVPGRAGPVLAWSPVALPPRVEVRTLTSMGERLLVGGLTAAATTGGEPGPALLTIDAAGTQATVPLTPQSPYAFVARWYSVVTDGTRIVAVGGANGGAHGNVRWTTWEGTAAGVTELPQSFYTFGGWGAGELVDAVITPGGDALVGSWGGERAGLDAAVWTFADRVWTRQDPAGTPLQSTETLLVGPRGGTADGAGILVTGSALHLGEGSVGQSAAVWISPAAFTGWHRLDLPDPGTHSESVSARCVVGSTRCLVAGQVDGSLALWTVDGDRASRVTGIPAVSVDDQDVVPAPAVVGATNLVVTPDATQTQILAGDGASWTSSAGPAGLPTAAALVGDRLYVATRPSTGAPAALWSARWSG